MLFVRYRRLPSRSFCVHPMKASRGAVFHAERAKQETSQGAALNIADQILEVFPDSAPVTEVMTL